MTKEKIEQLKLYQIQELYKMGRGHHFNLTGIEEELENLIKKFQDELINAICDYGL